MSHSESAARHGYRLTRFAPWMGCFSVITGFVAARPAPAETVMPSTYWRNTITLPADAFRSQGYNAEDPGWIKFTIFKSDLTRVYFQNSNQYPFHYDFAHALVTEYAGFTRSDFDQHTLHPADQLAVLGAVIMPHWVSGTPPESEIREYGLQFDALEPYDPAFVVTLFELVRSKITAPAGTQPFYFPSFEQQATADENHALFEAQGIAISSVARWSTQNAIYAPGWALGTLKFFPAAEITPAYLGGQLLNTDILLTDGVPAEVPMVAGIVSLVPSTPNSHVAILSNTFGIPFAYLSIADDVSRAQQLIGHRVVLRAINGGVYSGNTGVVDVRLLDGEGLTPQQVNELLALRTLPPLDIVPVTPYGAFSAPTTNLHPADIRYFGGKAANFGMIRRSIPNNSPVATAFSFDLWTAFMSQTMTDGRTLCATIRARLAGYTYPPNMAALAADLQAVRDLIEDETAFAPALQTAILATLQDPQYHFDSIRNIRFRSSTNVEDTEEFSGAGMYDSFSGCLADELDGNTQGPCLCDPTEAKERGVFRAIRKVYASFYNDNAFIERLRHNVNEDQVGMGLLVHHSYPDENELANGVATYKKSGSVSVTLVTQAGAVSVTNPPEGSIPEEVRASVYGDAIYPSVVTRSNLVPLGGTVLTWDAEYKQLVTLLKTVATTFETTTGKSKYTLDFEYKKVGPSGRLEIKQVRELAMPDTVADTVPFLMGAPVDYCTYQGGGDVFSNHRLKVRWELESRSFWLTAQQLQTCAFAGNALTYVDEDRMAMLAGSPVAWPAFSHTYASNVTTDGWRIAGAENPTVLTLTSRGLGVLVSDAQVPVLVLSDMNSGSLELRADYGKPVPIVRTYDGRTTTTVDSVTLQPCPPALPTDILVQRTMQALVGKQTVSIVTRFYWPKPPGFAAGYTAPLVRWDQTTITGLTTQPMVLHGYFAQTYKPEHHNFSEHFLFEPGLEEGLPAEQRAELRAKNIRLIYAYTSGPIIKTYGFVAPGDFNHDDYVNAADLGHFQACVSGPAIPQQDVGCADADLDDDADVDQADFALLQACLYGSKVADPNCLPL